MDAPEVEPIDDDYESYLAWLAASRDEEWLETERDNGNLELENGRAHGVGQNL